MTVQFLIEQLVGFCDICPAQPSTRKLCCKHYYPIIVNTSRKMPEQAVSPC